MSHAAAVACIPLSKSMIEESPLDLGPVLMRSDSTLHHCHADVFCCVAGADSYLRVVK